MRFLAENKRPGLPRLSGVATAGLALFGVVAIFVASLAFVIVVLPGIQSQTAPSRPLRDAAVAVGVSGSGSGPSVTGDIPLRAAVGVSPLIMPTPLDIAGVFATAEARSDRSLPVGTASSSPVGGAPPSNPGAEKPAAVAPVKPGVVAGTPTPTAFVPATPTRPPTRTVTHTSTPTATLTPTRTPTVTPQPSPCTTAVSVPGLSAGYGYLVSVTHETIGHLAVQWPGTGGSILLYRGRPAAFGDVNNGVIGGVPADVAMKQGTSGPSGIRVPDQNAGQFTFFFFNGSPVGSPPTTASITYWTYGHCP